MSYGYDPRVAEWSPWHGAQTAVLSSLAKITCVGGKATRSRFSFQEFFGRTSSDKAWGYPASALLGSVDAQNAMGCASIGGKDSMSGTFENLNVPHTLVSFAVTHDTAKNVNSGSFKKGGDYLYLVMTPYTDMLAPDFGTFKKNSDALYELNKEGKINAMYPVGAGGIAEAVSKMAFGSNIGCQLTAIPSSATAVGFHRNVNNTIADLFTPLYGSIIVETDDENFDNNPAFVNTTVVRIGNTQATPVISVAMSGLNPLPFTDISLSDLKKAWEGRLATVFPPVSHAKEQESLPDFAKAEHPSLEGARHSFTVVDASKTKPRVIIPVFPGTNCEYDMARAFTLNGAEAKIFVFRNNTPKALEESLIGLQKEINDAQILAFAGGFSAGDEPDGSGKFIANVIREQRIADAVTALLENRKGLILGICNGFQALIKLGLVPYGKIIDTDAGCPTLTFNKIARHQSKIVQTRIASVKSPWLSLMKTGDIVNVPISHGEGRFLAGEELIKELAANGQIATQYVDLDGSASLDVQYNPNGSAYAIEGITSPDGRVFGKMGHSERVGSGLYKNVPGNYDIRMFEAAVKYFKG